MEKSEIPNEAQMLLGVTEVRAMLGGMPRATFYRYIKKGIIPRQQYLGSTPVWPKDVVEDLIKNLPQSPDARARNSSR